MHWRLITFRTLLHLGPNVITFRTLLHLGQLLHLGLQQPSTKKTLLATTFKVDSGSKSWEFALLYLYEIVLLGNFQEALDDATVSAQLAPTFIEAIEIGKFCAASSETCRNCFTI